MMSSIADATRAQVLEGSRAWSCDITLTSGMVHCCRTGLVESGLTSTLMRSNEVACATVTNGTSTPCHALQACLKMLCGHFNALSKV